MVADRRHRAYRCDLDAAKAACAAKVEGLTTAQATKEFPTSLLGILQWLGLAK